MKIFVSILALLSSTSVVIAQVPLTTISWAGEPAGPCDYEDWEPGEDPVNEIEVETSVVDSWKFPSNKPYGFSDLEKHWWISPAWFKIQHKYAKLCVVHGQGGKDHCPVAEVYSQTKPDGTPDPNDGSYGDGDHHKPNPNFSCPSQKKKRQGIKEDYTKLEGLLLKDEDDTDAVDFLHLKWRKTKKLTHDDDEHPLSLTCWVMKIKPDIVYSNVYNSNDGGLTGYDLYDKPKPFASFCFRIILQNDNEFVPYHAVDAAEDKDGGRYLQDTDTAETLDTPDTGDSIISHPPPDEYPEPPEQNMDITYCDTGVTIYFDLKAGFKVRGFKTQAMNPGHIYDKVNFKLRAYVGYCHRDWGKVHEQMDLFEALPPLAEIEAQDDLEGDQGEDNDGDGRRLRRLQEETVLDTFGGGKHYPKFWQKEEIPLCICTKKHSLAFIDHITNLRFVGKRYGHEHAEQTLIFKGKKNKKLVKVDCDKHDGKCCEVRVILDEDFYIANNYKSTLYAQAYGEAWMQVGEKGYLDQSDSRRLVEASFGGPDLQELEGRNLQELEAPEDGSAGEAEFGAVLELQEASGSFAMVGGSALGAIASMIVAVLFV